VKLDKLGIAYFRPGKPGRGHALAKERRWRRRLPEKTTRTTRGKNDPRGHDIDRNTALTLDASTDHPARHVPDQGPKTTVLPDFNVGRRSRRQDQCGQNSPPGTVTPNTRYPSQRMGGLAAYAKAPIRITIKRSPQGGQPFNGFPSISGQGKRGGLVNKAGTGGYGILQMQAWSILKRQGRCQATLGPRTRS
jgi:hypothetical protein